MKKILFFSLIVILFIGISDHTFADDSKVTIEPAQVSRVSGCEGTSQGCYIPSTATVDIGGVVIFSNTDSVAHTFTSGDPNNPETVALHFDSSLIMPGSALEWSPTQTGEIPYHCMVHPWMQGLIIVSGPEGTDVVIPQGTVSPGCEETRSCYDPYRIIGGRGSTITWYNADSAAHTVTSGSDSSGSNDEFDSSLIMFGDSFSHKFSDDGTYPYFCTVHPWMQGQVIISRGGIVNGPPPIYLNPAIDTTAPKILKPTDITINAENPNGANVTYDVLVIDETDKIVRSSCNSSSGALFSVGTTKVTCNAMDSAGNRAQSVSFSVTVNPPQLAIPDWVKNIAAFWCDDKIDDTTFIEGIQYLIDNDIIIVSTATSVDGSFQDVPQWVKNNACWWSEGLISNTDFASGIEFLVKEGIIRV